MFLHRLKKYFQQLAFIALVIYSQSVMCNNVPSQLNFLMVYESNDYVEIQVATLYFSSNKLFKKHTDSLKIDFLKSTNYLDTIRFDKFFDKPMYLKLKIETENQTYNSNTFQFVSTLPIWDVYIADDTLRVKNKVVGDDFDNQISIKGLILIIQAIFEMLITWIIARTFGWTSLTILMVLVGNLAAFPVYLLGIDSLLYRDLLIFGLKTGIMSLVGMKKLKVWKIVLLAVILTSISFGFKEFCFFIIRIF